MDVAVYSEVVLRYPSPTANPNWNENEFLLDQEFRFSVDGEMFTAPAGFVSDLASIPNQLRDRIPRYGNHLPASIAHDYLYHNQIKSRDWADQVFMEIMVHDKVPAWRRKVMWWAVRAFGKRAWND